ncbi:MAG: hypothetical protein JWM80_1930 [Cyanobacteria bacterium RYN_339]|nr:hypothetical protein [Cyanobacteria bacterium RYN_339]
MRRLNERLAKSLALASLPEPLHSQASAVVLKALHTAERFPGWPVVRLPYEAMRACGAGDALAGNVAAAAVLFYCAADITDDAQDGELAANPAWQGWDWRQAVNAGNAFVFLALAELMAQRVAAPVKARWATAYAHAGRRLTGGQALDLAGGNEALVRAEKSGASWAFLASVGPLYADLPVQPWRDFGQALGALYQLATDVHPYTTPFPHRDLAQGKPTLPLAHALALDPSLAGLWEQGELDPRAQAALRARVAATGAVMYAQMRVDILKDEATELAASLPPAAARRLQPLVDAVNVADDVAL